MASPAKEPRRNWLELPPEVTALIFSRLTVEVILTNAQIVCKAWLDISKDPLVWNRIDTLCLKRRKNIVLDKMCRHAVDRSCGQAVDVNLEYFPDDDLLKYIADRSSRIKRLRLSWCSRVSNKGLIEAVEKLPDLENLELTLCSFAAEILEAVGQKCPRLRAFRLKWTVYVPKFPNFDKEDELNKDAVAIGKSMPGLKSLQLINNSLTNKGLRVILDGCPGLESLDLRVCSHIRLKGKVWKRCVKRVKYLRLPQDRYDDDDDDFSS